MSKFVTEEMMEQAIHFLANSSEPLANARAERVRAEHRRKRVRANLILQSDEKSAIMREAWAETQQAYVDACELEYEAIRQDEYYRAERNTADSIIEAWRSEQANQRAGQNFK